MMESRRFPSLRTLLGGALLFGTLSGCEGSSFLLGRLRSEPGAGGTPSVGGALPDASGGATGGGTTAGGGSPGDDCALPAPSHRFDFSGTGATLESATSALGATVLGGAALDGSGSLFLDGVDDFVSIDASPLPSGRPFGVGLWFEYRGEAAFQRLFDFGSQGGPEDNLVGTTYLAVTPKTGFVPSGLAVLFSEAGSAGEIAAVTDSVLGPGTHHVFVAVEAEEVALYLDGTLLTRVPHSITLTNFAPTHHWLGRSQYAQDPYGMVTYFDVAFFDEALPDCRVAALFEAGFPG